MEIKRYRIMVSPSECIETVKYDDIKHLLEPRWVSVKDRLPEDTKPVFCRVDLGFKIVHFECSYYEKRNDFNWCDWCGDRDTDEKWEVTHWMPLLELLKE